MTRTILVSATLVAAFTMATVASAEDKKPPFAAKKKKAGPKPAHRNWTVSQGDEDSKKFTFDFGFTPGIPNAGQVTEVMLNVGEIPKTPHPRYGRLVPQTDARIILELESPAGQVVARYLAHAIPLSGGKYGLHITPKQDGIYTLRVTGKTKGGDELKAEVKLPVNVWPLPDELQGSGEAKKTGRRRPIAR